jgi:hypothetical protein
VFLGNNGKEKRALERTIGATMKTSTAATTTPMEHEARQILPLRLHHKGSVVERVARKHQGRLYRLRVRELNVSGTTINVIHNPYPLGTPCFVVRILIRVILPQVEKYSMSSCGVTP